MGQDTIYGLAAYYFTRDIGRVMRLTERLEYGILGANDSMPSTAQASFGGVKEFRSDARAVAVGLRSTRRQVCLFGRHNRGIWATHSVNQKS